MATALSNLIAFVYFIAVIARHRGNTVITASPACFTFGFGIPREVCTVGIASAMMNLLGITSNTVLNNLMSSYSDAALAGMGIAKKIDMLTFAMSIGMTQGVISLIGYNYSSKNYTRMISAIKTVFVNAMVVAVVTTLFLFFCAAPVSRFFIEDADTVNYGHRFLRILCIICPMQAASMSVITVFQALGRKTPPLVLSLLRKGIIDIPPNVPAGPAPGRNRHRLGDAYSRDDRLYNKPAGFCSRIQKLKAPLRPDVFRHAEEYRKLCGFAAQFFYITVVISGYF